MGNRSAILLRPANRSVWVGGLFAQYKLDEAAGQQALNSSGGNGASLNLLGIGEQLFSGSIWSVSGVTITDHYEADPFGGTNASRATSSSAADDYLQLNGLVTPAGTYTLSCYVKSNTGIAQNVRLRPWAGFTSNILIPADGTWTRISTTFTLGSQQTWGPCVVANDAAHDAMDVSVYGAELVVGSSPSTAYTPARGDLTLGISGTVDGREPTWQTGYLSWPSAGNKYAWGVLHAPLSLSAVSVYVAFRWPAANTLAVSGQAPLLNELYASNKLRLALGTGSGSGNAFQPALQFNNSEVITTLVTPNDSAWHILAGTYDGVTLRVYLDDAEMASLASVVGAVSLQQLWLGWFTGTSYAAYDMAYVLAYSRAHTAGQQRQVSAVLRSRLASRGLSAPALTKIVAFEGDSITNGSVGGGAPLQYWPLLALRAIAPIPQGRNYAVVGNTLTDLTSRAATVDALYSSARSRNVLHILIGRNDFSAGTVAATFVANLKTYCLARRATGWKVIVGTMLPSTLSGFSAWRSPVNAAIIADPSFYDGLSDFAADATIGPDAAASNATYFADGTHPTDAARAIMAPIAQATITAALA